MIIREEYLNRIRPFYNSEMIKVITGMRRSGKSVFLKQIINELEQNNIPKENIIYINLEDFENRCLYKDEQLFKYIKTRLVNNKKYYIFIDEIQNVIGFERVINSFRSTHDCSIFITGSNSSLLSSEIATLLSGRTISIHMLPFKFSEFVEFNKTNNKDLDTLLFEYLKWGGIPLVIKQDEETKSVVLENIYDSIVQRDIITREKRIDNKGLTRIIDYLVGTSSKTISGRNISNILKENGFKISVPTVYNYIDSIVKACIIDKIKRYDINGKKILAFEEKMYTKDIGFFNLRKTKLSEENGAIIETVIYNELISRGYKVYIGKTKNSEIDFIAEKHGRKCYIQACYLLTDGKTAEREFSAYDSVLDNYPKYVISLDKITNNRNGIIHLNLIDFLLNPNLID